MHLFLYLYINIYLYHFQGCKNRNWREFIIFAWNLLYENMVYRELLVEKTKCNVTNELNEKNILEGFNNFLNVI